MEKKCLCCGEMLPIESFYQHKMMADGHLNFCKKCVKERVKKHRAENIDRVRKYDRERTTEERLARNREWHSLHKDAVALTKRNWALRNRDKRTAQQRLRRAMLAGIVSRPESCEQCHTGGRVESHHMDYSKPLDVIWLCDRCHKKVHKDIREAARMSAKITLQK